MCTHTLQARPLLNLMFEIDLNMASLLFIVFVGLFTCVHCFLTISVVEIARLIQSTIISNILNFHMHVIINFVMKLELECYEND